MLKFAPTIDGYVARPEGRATMHESPAFSSFVSQILENEPETTVRADLSGVDYLDSTFLGCLLMMHKRFSMTPPPRFTVFTPPDIRRQFLSPICLDQLLVFADEDDVQTTMSWVKFEPDGVAINDLGRHALEAHQRLAELGGRHAAAFQRVAEGLARDLGNA